MASQSQDIFEQLRQTQKRAAKKVSDARKRREQRLKQAREEAQAEIEEYRLQREKEFKAKEAEAQAFLDSYRAQVEKETQEKIRNLQTRFKQNKEEVLENLLSCVCDIRPEIHKNYRANE